MARPGKIRRAESVLSVVHTRAREFLCVSPTAVYYYYPTLACTLTTVHSEAVLLEHR